MNIYTNRELLSLALSPYRSFKKVGFVPTMGALHEGHLSLVQRALKENDCVVVSVFVNPTQFENKEDLEKYPQTLDEDILLLSKLKGVLFIYAPKATDLYNGHVESKKYDFGNLENQMEGKHRKGHFAGVATVVNLLFLTVRPDNAYFGEKDYQQLQIIKKLVTKENLSVKIIGCPIIREKNGLAMSSRNKRLNSTQFEAAALIYNVLREVKQKFNMLSISDLTKLVMERFLTNEFLQIEYFEIANEKTLNTAKRKYNNKSYRAFIAVYVDKVRLIDNMSLN